MPQNCDLRYEESFNSFLAGVFLTTEKINNFEFFNYMNEFSNMYNVDIVGIGNDICIPIYFDDNEIKITKSMEDIICVNHANITVREYLYSLTSNRVREFFNISDIQNKSLVFGHRFKPFSKVLLRKMFSTSI